MADTINFTAGADSSPKKKNSETNVKETIEAILVAFILAFIFRAFVVEAFVIPTGSMATTLLGAHMRHTCEDCGYSFTVNYPAASDGDDVTINPHAGPIAVSVNDPFTGQLVQRLADRVYAITCPNCGYRIPRNSLNTSNDATNPPTHFGDRILVLKYLYLFKEPSRFDVVVFKSPSQPERYDYTQNYIKRLIGKPGETIMLLYGDIYTSTADKPLDQLTPADFQIQRKPRSAQDALWRIVYDNDFLPSGAPRSYPSSGLATITDPAWQQPWKRESGESGWTLGSDSAPKRTFSFDNSSGSGSIVFDPESNARQSSLTDWLAYDATFNQDGYPADQFATGGYNRNTLINNVSDVKLSFFYRRKSGTGPLTAEISKWDRKFVAEFAQNVVSLFAMKRDGTRELLSSTEVSGLGEKPTRIDLLSVDYKLSVRVDDDEVVSTTPTQWSPDVADLLTKYRSFETEPKTVVRITAEKQVCELTHVNLWRDCYYADRDGGKNPLTWATPYDFPKRLMRLNSDEFFTCGDNSFVSADGRYWKEPIDLPDEGIVADSGRVPRRFLLGKAFFVYWPAGYRPIADSQLPGLIPNFGEMRFIH